MENKIENKIVGYDELFTKPDPEKEYPLGNIYTNVEVHIFGKRTYVYGADAEDVIVQGIPIRQCINRKFNVAIVGGVYTIIGLVE